MSPRCRATEQPRFSCSVTRMSGKLLPRWNAVPSELPSSTTMPPLGPDLGEDTTDALLYKERGLYVQTMALHERRVATDQLV